MKVELLVPIIVLCLWGRVNGRNSSKVALSVMQSITWPTIGSRIGDKTSINTLGLLNGQAFDLKRGRLMKIHVDGS